MSKNKNAYSPAKGVRRTVANPRALFKTSQLTVQPSAPSEPEDIRQETVNMTDKACYDLLKEAMDLAFKADGTVGALTLAAHALKTMDEGALGCEEAGYTERMTRACCCGYLLTEWLPEAMSNTQKVIEGHTLPA